MNRAMLRGIALLPSVLVGACGAGAQLDGAAPIGASNPAASTIVSAPPIDVATPLVELSRANTASVGGASVAFDGQAEGLVWPALDKALVGHKGQLAVVQVARDVPIQTLLRVVWTLRTGDIRLQTSDDAGAMRVVELKAKREAAAPAPASATKTCHLAVFLKPDGSLRVAAPGGPRDIAGAKPVDLLVRALQAEQGGCPLRYIAFGAESNDVPWGPVFDVMLAVDRVKAAGAARYVIGEAIRAPK